MNYFVSENIFTFNSGTEHAQARRVKLFAALSGEAQGVYVTRNYNRFLARDREAVGLTAQQSLNMYDFFQNTQDVPRVEAPLRELKELPLDHYKIDAEGPNSSTLSHAGREIANIAVMPATVGLVNTITYQDRFGSLVARDNYDWRGFKSSVDYFHPTGDLARTVYLNLEGQPVLETVHMNIDGQLRPTMWKLLNYKGKNYRFNYEDQLFLFFLNEVLAAAPGSRLISDRRTLDAAVGQAQGASEKWAYLHDVHEAHGELLPAYAEVLRDHPENFTGVFVATAAQQADLAKKHPAVHAVIAPDTFVEADAEVAGTTAHIPGRIVMIGRLAPEKRPDQALRIFATVKKRVPTATLELRGYASSEEYMQTLKAIVEKEGLGDSVIFSPYATGEELARSYAQAQVILSTSEHEGLGMHLVDALGYGLPIVEYGVTYGGPEVVKQGENGWLVPDGNRKQMTDKLVGLLTDSAEWQKMHDAALNQAAHFTREAAARGWQEALRAAVAVQ
ncbi:glycosyltransferase [Lacticaseibacillus mingshuiensis]|uniref:Glycosyltransferase n=1 Tax=Lacticaseibacillus mingshuiensis TaxID=2799574 RepID=A0ABW4CKF5_9LACO|nr:glycosyltransferase [Lacticaseibacillus mingshuiensis]